jgi:hypothetical protein
MIHSLIFLVSFLSNVLRCHSEADFGIFRSEHDFRVKVAELKLKSHIAGGSGGVYLLEGKESNYTLKFNADIKHFQEEIMADSLYGVLATVPKFIVVSNYSLFEPNIRSLIGFVPYVRIAELIVRDNDSADPTQKAAQIKYFRDNFVLDAFMANRDASKDGNTIVKNGLHYKIDNGGSLRSRSVGRVKGQHRSDPWDPELIPELRTMPKYNPVVYQGIEPSAVEEQAKRILAHAGQLGKQLQLVSHVLLMDSDSKRQLTRFLTGRLRVLEMLLHPGVSYPVTSPLDRGVSYLTGAGAFIMCDGLPGAAAGAAGAAAGSGTVNPGASAAGTAAAQVPEVLVLLGARRSKTSQNDGAWVTTGGKAEVGADKDKDKDRDQSLFAAASRELFEESMGLMTITAQQFADPAVAFHDLVRPDFLYRQFFIKVDLCVDAAALLSAPRPPSLRGNKHVGTNEYHQFRWFPLSQLLNVTATRAEFGSPEEGNRVYHSFQQMLIVPHVRSLLQAFQEKKTPPSAQLFTQSMVSNVYGNFSPTEQEFGQFTFDSSWVPLHKP